MAGEAPLADIRVVELGLSRAAAYCGRLLADLGAQVIKVEPPGGDPMRTFGPMPKDVPEPACGGLFVYFHGGKESVVLDGGAPSFRDDLAALLARADILVSERQMGPVDCWPMDAARLSVAFPRLVHVALSPFGESGPYAAYEGNALTAWAMSGIMYATGAPDREPLANGVGPADFFAGQQALLAALAALEVREMTGLGDYADISMAEAMTAGDDYTASVYATCGAVRTRFNSQHMWGFPATIAPCKDGYVTVIAGAAHANALALLVEDPDLETHELFQSPRARQVRQQEFLDLLAPWLTEHPASEVLDRAQMLGLPFAPVLDIPGLAENPQLAARQYFRTVEQDGWPVAVPGPAVTFSACALAPARPAPGLDADHAAIATGVLP